MLTIEEIKKACEFAEGYEWGTNNPVDHYLRFTIEKDRELVFLDSKTFKYIYYPLFLQRVIEGMNSSRHADDWLILTPTNSCFMCINNSDQNKVKSFYFDREKHIIDQAKEEAIRYILGKL